MNYARRAHKLWRDAPRRDSRRGASCHIAGEARIKPEVSRQLNRSRKGGLCKRWRGFGRHDKLARHSLGGALVIVGLGTDIVEVERISRMIERHGNSFVQRIFTPAEIEHCQQRKHSAEPFAGSWAAKEAVMKVLGTGFIQGTHFQEIEDVSELSGRPRVVLHGSTAEIAKQLGINDVLITISHCREYATATAIGVRQT